MMGRDNKQGKSKNKASLPQTPANQKIAPSQAREEVAKELAELEKLTTHNRNQPKKQAVFT